MRPSTSPSASLAAAPTTPFTATSTAPRARPGRRRALSVTPGPGEETSSRAGSLVATAPAVGWPGGATPTATFTWPSAPDESYLVEESFDLNGWMELDDRYLSGGETTSYMRVLPDPTPEKLFFRVSRNE